MNQNNDGKFAEDFAENIRNLMDAHGLPHINISVEKIKTPYTETKTPLTVLSAKIEAVVNILLWDYSAGMLEAGFLLHQLENQVEDIMNLGSYLRLRYDGGTSKKGRANKTGTTSGEGVGNKPRGDESEGGEDATQGPLPQIFSDILKELTKEPLSKKPAAAKKVSAKAKAKKVPAKAKVKKATTRKKIPKTEGE